MSTPDIRLTAEEIHQITGYAQPARQLAELHKQGFFRARRSPTTGEVILERAHHDAVCSGQVAEPKGKKAREPQLREPA